ncbi:hypothetical protein ACQP3C_30320, partial [Escherichia coli]
QHFVLIGVDTYSAYKLDFPTCNDSTKMSIHELTEYPIHHHNISEIIASHSQRDETMGSQSWNPLIFPCSPSF